MHCMPIVPQIHIIKVQYRHITLFKFLEKRERDVSINPGDTRQV